MPTLLATCHHLLRNIELFRPELEKQGVTVIAPPIVGQQFDEAGMIALIDNADAVIAGDDFVTRTVLEKGKAAKLSQVIKWGIGVDSIDLEAARELNIPIYNTPGVFSEEVADLAFTFLLMMARPLHKMSQTVRDGGWQAISGRTLNGLTVGIVGCGSIGQAIARRCNGFGMTANVSDPYTMPENLLRENGISEQLELDDLVASSDIVIVACALTADNHRMMNADRFANMRNGSYFINVGRGPLVDEAALAAALEKGNIAAAGLDVFEVEPLPDNSQLRKYDNVIFGCHCGSNTREAVHRINQLTVDMALHLMGKVPSQELSLKPVV